MKDGQCPVQFGKSNECHTYTGGITSEQDGYIDLERQNALSQVGLSQPALERRLTVLEDYVGYLLELAQEQSESSSSELDEP